LTLFSDNVVDFINVFINNIDSAGQIG